MNNTIKPLLDISHRYVSLSSYARQWNSHRSFVTVIEDRVMEDSRLLHSLL